MIENMKFDAETLIELARTDGMSVVHRIIQDKPVYDEPTRASSMVYSEELAEAVKSYEPRSQKLAMRLESKALEIGKLLPRIQIAMRNMPGDAYMLERKAALALLDAGMEAHRQLQAWSSRAGEYRTNEAKRALDEFDGLIMMLQQLTHSHEYEGGTHGFRK